MSVVVTAVFHPVAGREAELVAALRVTIPAVHEEQGCCLYAIHDADDGTITMLEKWTSREDLDAHAAGAATAAPVPPLEPPEVFVVSYGLDTVSAVPAGWRADHCDDRLMANSSIDAFATMTAPSARRPSTMVASVVVWLPFQHPQPAVVGMSMVL